MKRSLKILNYIWPVLFIFILWLFFASPYFILHKVPFPSTYLVNSFSPWNSYTAFTSPVKNNAMPDVITQIYPWKNTTIKLIKDFQIPLWNPYSFSGTPLLANYQSAVFTPLNILFLFFSFLDAWSLMVLLQPLLAGIFMYLCIRSFGNTKSSSVLGSISFMFCGFLTVWMAYGTLGYAILYLPLAIFAIQQFYNLNKIKYLNLLAITIPLSFFSGHFQISIYFLFALILFAFFKFYEKKNIKYLIYTLIYILCGILISLVQIIPSIELYTQSLRSSIFAKMEAIPFAYLPTFIAPDFLGNPVTRNDWFGHYAEWNSYIGLIPLILSFYAFLKLKKNILYFAVISLVALLFSFQTPFLDLLILLKVPVLSTSAASRMIVLFSFGMSFLCAVGFDYLINDLINRRPKKILIILGLFITIFLFLWVLIVFRLVIPLDKIFIAKQNLILPSLILFLFILLILLIQILKIKSQKFFNIFILLILIITSLEMIRFTNKWMPFENSKFVYPNVPIVKEFNKFSSTDRVFGSIGNETTNYYRLNSVEGYDALYIKRYGELLASLSNGKLQESQRSVVELPKNGLDTPKAINLLGVKYIIHKISNGREIWEFPYWTYKDGSFSLIYNDGIYQIFKNNLVIPRAFLVNNYKVETKDQKILDLMFSNNINLEKTAILENNLNLKTNNKSNGKVKLISYKSTEIKLNANSDSNSILVLTDNYYPGWNAYIDNKLTKIYRADYTFRAILLPKGNHVVEFKYEPLSFKIGEGMAIIGIILICLLTLVSRKRLFGFPKF